MGSSIDILPTLLEAAGGGVPEGVQGRSLLGVLDGSAEEVRDCVYIESPDGARSVWMPRARLTWHGAGRRGELYDHAADPNCCRNLWEAPSHSALKKEMLDRLVAAMVANVDPLPVCRAPC